MSQTPEDQEFFLQPILSTYVRSGRVGEAIALADTEQALNHLALLISTDKLYEEALATYNLEKALKIAGKLRFIFKPLVNIFFPSYNMQFIFITLKFSLACKHANQEMINLK